MRYWRRESQMGKGFSNRLATVILALAFVASSGLADSPDTPGWLGKSVPTGSMSRGRGPRGRW